MRILKLLIFLAVLTLPLKGWPQSNLLTDTLLNRLTSKWLLTGNIAGSQTEHDVTCEWVLGHQYLQIKETSREKKADGHPSYDAIIYVTFDTPHNQYDCLWLDNTSNAGLSNEIIAHAKKESNRIALLFKFTDHSFFHTTLSYNAARSSWNWIMTSEENGKVEPFANALMTKLK